MKSTVEIVKRSPNSAINCGHYWGKCEIKCERCQSFHKCKHCHDMTTDHILNRKDVINLKCLMCGEEQEISNCCIKCGAEFGEYYCKECIIYENGNCAHKLFHCSECGMCRKGERRKYKHCKLCECCISTELKEHVCISRVLKQNCPICLRDMFSSIHKLVRLPSCGHCLHAKCFEMLCKFKFQCPLCYKSFCDMSAHNTQLEHQIISTPMPNELNHKIVIILCNDCQAKTKVNYHFLGAKCPTCHSFNTRLA